VPRESGASSTPQLYGSINWRFGVLDHPLAPVIGRRYSADPLAGGDGGGWRFTVI
jgi:hypothetical protein